jgi:hypothetical protein
LESEQKVVYAPTPEHQLAVTTDTIAERLSGPTEDFDTLEKTAHLKAGLEIPLMGVASMPDTLEKIYEHRLSGGNKKPLSTYGRLRYEHAISMMRSMDKHFLQLSVGVDGKRAGHLVDLGKAIQSHNASQTEDKGRLERIIEKVKGR